MTLIYKFYKYNKKYILLYVPFFKTYDLIRIKDLNISVISVRRTNAFKTLEHAGFQPSEKILNANCYGDIIEQAKKFILQ